MNRVLRLLFVAGFLVTVAYGATPPKSISPALPDASMLKGMQWREVGPYRGGRADAVVGIADQPNVYYFGSTGGGVWKTTDGAQSWKPVSDGFFGGTIGAVAVAPSDPSVVYAGTGEETIRGNVSPGAGMWKSTDAGKSWTHIGLDDSQQIARIRVHPSNPDLLYVAALGHAFGPNDMRGVYRSRDGGDTWAKTSDLADLRQRAWYYSRIYADPKDEDTAYVVNVRFHKTKDGGRTWSAINTPHGDNHDLWIAPNDPRRMIEANDGGVNVTTDGGVNWTKQDNQPTAQFYRVSVDTDFPYRLLGPQQDNSAVRIRHQGAGGGIGPRDWEETAGGESGYIVADPKNPDIVYGGSYGGLLTIYNHRTGEERDVNPWPDNPMGWGAAGIKHRFQWNFPIFFSPNDPSKVYAASQFLMESTNAGQSWKVISPDLTRNDPTKEGPSGGPITKDNTSVEYYDTIFYGAESPVEAGVLWVGSDDGLVHVSRDGGAHWDNVTPPKTIMPEWIMINEIDASPTDKGAAYVAATNFKWDDFHPYLYKTADYGKTWTKIVDGIPPTELPRAIRAATDE